MRSRRFKILIVLAALFFGFVIADSLGIFDSSPYNVISHGNHSHYVPKDRDPNVPLDDFPMQPPGPNERITPTGQVVPIE
jgi:hypothetical protein